MGNLCCSYYINNRVSRIRKAVLSSQVESIKTELRQSTIDSITHNDPYNLINVSIDSNGNTPLILAIESRQLRSFNYLLNELNVDPNVANKYTLYTPLHICALAVPLNKRKESAQSKISKSLNNINTINESSIMEKSTYSNKSESQLNKETGHSDRKDMEKTINKKKKLYESTDSAIVSIITVSDIENSFPSKMIDYLSSQNPIKKEVLVEMIESLIKKGANLNQLVKVNRLTKMPGFESIKYATPLHVAVFRKNLTAIELLIKNGCDVNQVDPISKISPLQMACSMSKLEIVSLLLKSETIDVEAKSKNGYNCLHWLALSESDENCFGIAMLLIANLTKKFESLYSSLSNDFTEICNEKVKNFINQSSDLYSQTPLMFSCMKNKLNLIKILLDNEASIDIRDKNGLSAVRYAKNNESCIILLNSFNKLNKITMKRRSKIKNSNSGMLKDIKLDELSRSNSGEATRSESISNTN